MKILLKCTKFYLIFCVITLGNMHIFIMPENNQIMQVRGQNKKYDNINIF